MFVVMVTPLTTKALLERIDTDAVRSEIPDANKVLVALEDVIVNEEAPKLTTD